MVLMWDFGLKTKVLNWNHLPTLEPLVLRIIVLYCPYFRFYRLNTFGTAVA